MKPPHMTSKQRGTYYDSYGTPELILNVHRKIFGSIDIDLASDKRHNSRRVGAEVFYSIKHPAPAKPPANLRGKILWCNPPGPMKKVISFWDLFCYWIVNGDCCGSFLFFSADHFRGLERSSHLPLSMEAVMLRDRVKYVGAKSAASFPSILVVAASVLPIRTSHILCQIGLPWGRPA